MDTKEYNGWKNWATWNTALWFNNDEFLYHLALEADTPKDIKVIFNSEIELFKDFYDEDDNLNWDEIENIDWLEVFNGTGDRG